ncbi:MAG: DUF115 domain-containing protein [Anaerolineaceae bacterium]|nr:DUF115 domain-containing protein [Anaerolineaceae bacterium]
MNSCLYFIKNSWDFINRIPEGIGANLHPWRRESIRKMRSFHNKYKGERCFIIGNGPSLKRTDMTKLKNEYTFGMNRIFLLFPELGFKTSFLVSINDLVIEQSYKDFQKVNVPFFVSWRARKWMKPQNNLFYLYTTYTGRKFAKDSTRRLWEGATVTYSCLQLAYYMGFSKAILIGVDHSFITKGKPNTTVVSKGDDLNHFHPKYFGKGFKWQLPDLDTSEIGYRMARKAFEKDGRQVVDATIGGKLTIFPKVEYTSLFP